MASPGPAPAGSGLPVPAAAPGKANGANSQDIATFFPKINGDLTQVTWAHAVNSWSLLEKALNGKEWSPWPWTSLEKLSVSEGGKTRSPHTI